MPQRSIEDVRLHFENLTVKDDRRVGRGRMNERLGCTKEDYGELVTLSEKRKHSNAVRCLGAYTEGMTPPMRVQNRLFVPIMRGTH